MMNFNMLIRCLAGNLNHKCKEPLDICIVRMKDDIQDNTFGIYVKTGE